MKDNDKKATNSLGFDKETLNDFLTVVESELFPLKASATRACKELWNGSLGVLSKLGGGSEEISKSESLSDSTALSSSDAGPGRPWGSFPYASERKGTTPVSSSQSIPEQGKKLKTL